MNALTKTTFILFLFSTFLFSANAQLKQIYLDNDENNDVKNISFYSAQEGYIAFAKWIGYTTDGGKSYSKKYINSNVDYNGYSVNLTFGFEIRGVHAFDKNTIVVYGSYGFIPAILHSVDGGNTFKLIYQATNVSRTDAVSDMVFSIQGVGFALQRGAVLKSIDKGLSWNVVFLSNDNDFFKIQSFSSNSILVCDSKDLLKSVNNGQAWNKVNAPSGIIESFFFLSDLTGFVQIYSDSQKKLYKTIDGGINWTLQNNPVYYTSGDEFYFVNDTLGYSITGNYEVSKSTDGGNIWERLERDNTYSFLNYSFTNLFFLMQTLSGLVVVMDL